MSERGDEFGVSCRRWMPLGWRSQARSACIPERVAWLNQVNEKRLRMLLDRETRERPSADMASIEALLIEVLHNVKQSPPSRSVLLSAHNIEWTETSARFSAKPGDYGVVRLCLDPELPYEVEFFADVRTVQKSERGLEVEASLESRSDSVVDLYEQLVFIYYRRAQRDQKQELR